MKLADLLDEVFGDLPVSKQAEVLDVSGGHLSRLRNGHVALTKEIAQRIEARCTTTEQRARLRAFVGAPSASTGTVQGVFEKLASEQGLLCVNYGTPPRGLRGAPSAELVSTTVQAVEAGMKLAMFQPFGPAKDLGAAAYHARGQRTLARYRVELADRVHEFYEDVSRGLSKARLKQHPVVLYELRRLPEAGAMIGTRHLYTESSAGAFVYDAVAIDDGFRLITDTDQVFVRAVAEQFSPVIDMPARCSSATTTT